MFKFVYMSSLICCSYYYIHHDLKCQRWSLTEEHSSCWCICCSFFITAASRMASNYMLTPCILFSVWCMVGSCSLWESTFFFLILYLLNLGWQAIKCNLRVCSVLFCFNFRSLCGSESVYHRDEQGMRCWMFSLTAVLSVLTRNQR